MLLHRSRIILTFVAAFNLCRYGSRNNISVYFSYGQFVNMYHSVRETSFRTRISMSSIYKCVNGEHNTAGGFIWKYKNNQL